LCLPALVLALAANAQAQPGGGMGQRGMMGGAGAFMLEGDWALICFEMKVGREEFNKLYAVYQKAWDQRQEAIEAMNQGEGDRSMMMEEMGMIQQELDKAVLEILGREQVEKLQALRSQRRQVWGGGRGGGGPGGR
jgi:Spy/CpxP family protein refolding chaperone